MKKEYYPDVYRITKTQLRHTDIFCAVLGALYIQFRKLYKLEPDNRVELNEMIQLMTTMQTTWYYLTHNPNDILYSELMYYAGGYVLRDQLKEVVEYISENKHIELPKITAPDYIKNDDIYIEYIKGIIDIEFYKS